MIFFDKEREDLLRILTQEQTQNQEIVDMADSIIELSEQRGIQKGIEQGSRRTSIESTLAILNTRFPDADVAPLTPVLEAVEDLNRLKQLNLEASLVESFRAFQEHLQLSETRKKARTIAKLSWYIGTIAPQRLARYLDIDIDEVECILGSDEHLAAIEELIRTCPYRSGGSIEDWWAREWEDKPSAFAKRMRVSEEAASKLIEKVLNGAPSIR